MNAGRAASTKARAERMSTLRQTGGVSGYPNRAESPHDWIENSHASTALSYADGLSKAFAIRGEHRIDVLPAPNLEPTVVGVHFHKQILAQRLADFVLGVSPVIPVLQA